MSDSESYPSLSKGGRRFIKRPDEKIFKQRQDDARANIASADSKIKDIEAKIALTKVPKPVEDKRTKLQQELKALVAKQATLKQERTAIMDQVKLVDRDMKIRITEKAALIPQKYNFKSGAEVDARITSLDSLILSGTLSLAEERRNVKELSLLRKLRKDFVAVEKLQRLIDSDREKIAALKAKASETHNRQMQEQFTQTQTELDALHNSASVVTKQRNQLYDSLRQLKAERDSYYDELRQAGKDLKAAFLKFKRQVEEERKRYEEESKSEIEAKKLQERQQEAQRQLDAASVPAFSAEIEQIYTLLKYFDPQFVKPTTAVPGAFVPTQKPLGRATRVIEMPADAVVIKRETSDFFAGKRDNKPGKKGRAGRNAKRFAVDPDIIVALLDLSIPFPSKEEEVPETQTVLQDTLKALLSKQDEQTQINIARAKAHIAKVQAEQEAADKEAENAAVAKAEAEAAEPGAETETEDTEQKVKLEIATDA